MTSNKRKLCSNVFIIWHLWISENVRWVKASSLAPSSSSGYVCMSCMVLFFAVYFRLSRWKYSLISVSCLWGHHGGDDSPEGRPQCTECYNSAKLKNCYWTVTERERRRERERESLTSGPELALPFLTLWSPSFFLSFFLIICISLKYRLPCGSGDFEMCSVKKKKYLESSTNDPNPYTL